MAREEKFLEALRAWMDSTAALHAAAESYRVEHAKAYLVATGPDAARKAAADAATGDNRVERDACERAERADYHRMIFYRGTAGEAEKDF